MASASASSRAASSSQFAQGRDAVMPWLASHADVNAFDFAGGAALDWVSWQRDAAGVLARVVPPCEGIPERSLERITAFTEIKTIWHTKALG
jgi:hypothetical protein